MPLSYIHGGVTVKDCARSPRARVGPDVQLRRARWQAATPDVPNRGRWIIDEGAPIQDRLGFGEVHPRPRDRGPTIEEYRRAAGALLQALGASGPLVCLDLEATGIDVASDRIVELTLVRIESWGAVEVLDSLVDPGCSIPPAATRIHGITDDEVRGAPTLAELGPSIMRLMRAATLCGYNHGWYDLPLLAAELERAGQAFDPEAHRLVDACAIFKRMERRDLTAAVRFYCGEDLDGAHTAGGDVLATIRVLEGQLGRYPELPRSLDALDAFSRPRRRGTSS
jgi:DNA polymerase-3 subunit epsilon